MSKDKLKNVVNNVFRKLDRISYFLPDVFLAGSITFIFTDFDFKLGVYRYIVSVLLLIVYLATSYGEYNYMKVKTIEQMVDKHIEKLYRATIDEINKKEFVTMNGLMNFSDAVDQQIDVRVSHRIMELMDEMDEVEDAENEVDSEKTKEQL